jgi:hypothetical protein
VLSIPDVKDIVDEPDAVCVEIRFIAPPLKPLGLVVIADKELLLAKSKSHVMLPVNAFISSSSKS